MGVKGSFFAPRALHCRTPPAPLSAPMAPAAQRGSPAARGGGGDDTKAERRRRRLQRLHRAEAARLHGRLAARRGSGTAAAACATSDEDSEEEEEEEEERDGAGSNDECATTALGGGGVSISAAPPHRAGGPASPPPSSGGSASGGTAYHTAFEAQAAFAAETALRSGALPATSYGAGSPLFADLPSPSPSPPRRSAAAGGDTARAGGAGCAENEASSVHGVLCAPRSPSLADVARCLEADSAFVCARASGRERAPGADVSGRAA